MTIRLICPDCADTVEHHCGDDLRRAIVDFLTWVPEYGPATEELANALVEAGKVTEWIDGDDTMSNAERFDAPFFGSQRWSYPLLGSKDVARSFHGHIAAICRAAGVDEDEVMATFWRRRRAAEQEKADRAAAVAKRKDERAAVVAFLQDAAVPLDQRVAKLDEILSRQIATHKLEPYEEKGEFTRYLTDYLKTYFGGGISYKINKARIGKLEREHFEAAREALR